MSDRVHCSRCKRILRNPKWIAIGMGPVCARKAGVSFVATIKHDAPELKCPKCGSTNVARERRPNGNDICQDCNHTWPSSEGVKNESKNSI